VQAGRQQPRTAVAAAVNGLADAEKACERCGASYPLFYFPRTASQPDGHWVHCFGCRYALKLIAKPYRQCAMLHHAFMDRLQTRVPALLHPLPAPRTLIANQPPDCGSAP